MTVTESRSRSHVEPFAAGPVLSLAAVVAVAQCAAALFSPGFWFDEVYVVATGRDHLDWGSADQPPLTPALAALVDAVAPGSLIALRLPAILATMAAVVVAALIARELGCDHRAQIFVAAAQAMALWTTLAGHWLTPYALEPLQWMLLLWLMFRWQRVRDDRLWLAVGVIAGIALLNKFQVALLCVALLAAITACGPRDMLRRPMPWVGALIAVAIASPTLIWQQLHGWPQLLMAPVVAGEADALYGGRMGIAVEVLLFAGPAGALLAVYGLVRLWHTDELTPYRYVGVAFTLLWVVFVITEGRPYYLVGVYAPLMVAGAMGFQRRREAGRTPHRWLLWPAWAACAAAAVATLFASVTVVRSDVGEGIAQRTAEVLHGLPAEQRDRTVVYGESYIVAAFLDGFADRYGLPKTYSGNRGYGYFAEPPADHDVVLYVGRDPGTLSPYFAVTRRLGDIGDDMHAFLLVGLREPWESVWPRLRTLTVS